MQVANALNNTIRILFNPKVEPFKLFDFLMVKSLQDRYLAQIVEIYEDKFDSSQNVAKLKLFYKITQNNEVMPYDNFTPSKECEIIKVKSDEVEDFINNDKKTFIFATDVKTSQSLNIQYDFFNNNAIVLADKIENSNSISLNLAKKLSSEKNVILIDFTGVVELEEAKKITACKNFKLPLNFNTLDIVFDRCLADASLEFQAIGVEILNAIKKFAKKQEGGFIPFNAFVNVVLQQYKVTPYPELQLLVERIKKYQMYDIFAKNKKDCEALSKTFKNNKITIIDLSGIDAVWKKAYIEYIVSEITESSYVISRINDESFDGELISKIYNKNKNITFIPNVSYNYSKLPSIMQYCNNYILMPSLYQRSDFLDANFALSNLISEECILFGKNTDNFLYLACDYELEVQEKRKNYRKIALSMVEKDETSDITEASAPDSKKLMEELSDYESNVLKEYEENANTAASLHDEFQEITNQEKDEQAEKETIVQEAVSAQDDFEEIYKQEIKNIEEIKLTNEPKDDTESSQKIVNEIQENTVEEVQEDNKEEIISSVQEIQTEENQKEDIEETEPVENIEQSEAVKEDIEQPEEEIKIQQEEISLDDNHEIEISDEELDFFELAKNSQESLDSEITQNKNVVIDDVEYKTESDNSEEIIIDTTEDEKGDEELDLSEVASNAIENNFEEIINSKKTETKPTFEIDENTTIQVDVKEEPKENLPIFKEEIKTPETEKEEYEVGNFVVHNKYGRGKIVKIIQYDQRQLLQIDFDSSGKKLLDPKIAEIQLEQ